MPRSVIRFFTVLALLGVTVAPAMGASSPIGWSATRVLDPATLPGANGLGFDRDGALWVGSAAVGLFKVDKDTGRILEVTSTGGEWGADDLVFGPDGALYHTAAMNGTVGRLAPDGTHTVLNQAPIPGVNAIALSDDGRLFVATAVMGDALYEFDPTGATEPRLIVEGLGLNGFDWHDGVLWAPRMYTGELVTVDPQSGATTTIASGLTFPVSADVRTDGDVVVVDAGANHVVLIDPATGSQTLLAPNSLGDGLDNAAFDPDGRLFVSDNDTGSVMEIQDHGVVRVVTEPGITTGGGGITCVQWGATELVVAADLFDLHMISPAGEFEPFTVPGGPTKPGMAGMPLTAGVLATDRIVTTSWFDRSVAIFDPIAWKTVKSFPYPEPLGVIPVNAVGFGFMIVVAEVSERGSRLAWLNPMDGTTDTFAAMQLPTGIATDQSDLWAADWAAGTVARYVRAGTVIKPEIIADGLDQPEGLALLPDGTLVVVETGAGRVTHIDPATRVSSVIADGLAMTPNEVPSQPRSGFLTGVAVSADGSVWVSADGGITRLTPVDPPA